MIIKELEKIIAGELIEKIGKMELISIDIIRSILIDTYNMLVSGDITKFPDLSDIYDKSVPNVDMVNQAANNIASRLDIIFKSQLGNETILSSLAKVLDSYVEMERSSVDYLQQRMLQLKDSANKKTFMLTTPNIEGIENTDGVEVFGGSLSLRRETIETSSFASTISNIRVVSSSGDEYRDGYVSYGDPPPVFTGEPGRPLQKRFRIVTRPNGKTGNIVFTNLGHLDMSESEKYWSLQELPEDVSRIYFDVNVVQNRLNPATFVKFDIAVMSNQSLIPSSIVSAHAIGELPSNTVAVQSTSTNRSGVVDVHILEFDSTPIKKITATFSIPITDRTATFSPVIRAATTDTNETIYIITDGAYSHE